jgi:prolipoprotein diacylglyceryltransferase
MYNPFTSLFGRQWFSYTVLLMIAALVILLWLIYRAPSGKRVALIDVFLSGLISGIVVGRLIHVLSQWQYFADHTREIRKIYYEGGLNWHGVVIGALFGMAIMSRLRKIELRSVLDDIALLLPLVALMAWWGCGTIGCAYGLSVERMADYPQGFTWAQPDIFGITEPRFATQQLGAALAIGLFVLALILHWRDWLSGGRLWLLLLLLSTGLFALGFVRGDFSVMIYGLRTDQWLDIGMMLFAISLLVLHLFYYRMRVSPIDSPLS